MVGLLFPQSGEIIVENHQKLKETKSISYMPEGTSVYTKLTALQNLKFRGKVNNLSLDEIEHRSNELLNTFKLMNRTDDIVETFSNGMKKRLELACALITQPKLLILDEPTSSIDPESVYLIGETIVQYNKNGTTVILSTHDLSFADQISLINRDN